MKALRKQFRASCLERDENRCKRCPSTVSLVVHHITDRSEMPNGGYAVSNGVSLCSSCHMAAEIFHRTEGRNWMPGVHPDDLYELIGSSKEQAIKDSKKLLEE